MRFEFCLILLANTIVSDDTCAKKGECGDDDVADPIEDASSATKFFPFRFTSKSRYADDWDKFIGAYGTWQTALLQNKNLNCKDYEAVIFKPTAGLGDSANALSAAFMYTVNTGKMFFIDWKPWDWDVGFSGPGFPVDYKKLIKQKSICEHSKLLKLSGHITANHPLAHAKKLNKDIHFAATKFFQHFFAPSQAVLAVLAPYENIVTEKTVAIIIRTGWDDWQQFLLPDDPKKFPICLQSWRDNTNELPAGINVLVTSDREDVKREAVATLREMKFNVVALDESATHVQTPESMVKVHRTIAEFHLLSRVGYGLLTSSSLFGRTAIAELGGKELYGKFHTMSAADCDKPHKGYYRCASPKYPKFCPVDDKSHDW